MSLAGMTVGVIISAIDRASAPIKQIQGATSTLGRALESISTKAAMAGAALHGVALATSGLSSRMQQIGMQAVHAFAAFDDARATIASMPGVTQEALAKMQASAFAFTRQNRATLADYYNTAYNILSAGIPEALATYATEVSIKVGQATRGSADEAGEAVAILWNNMRDGSRDAAAEFARMGDIITATQQRFQIKNLSQLTEGLKYATPAAKTARLAVDDMGAALGRLNSAGLQGSMAGTALANLLANRFKAAQEIGFKVAVKKGTGELDLLRTLENLKAKIGDINRLTPEMEDKLRKGFGEEGFRAAMLLLGQTEVLKEDLAAIRGSAGAFDAASRVLNESAGAKWQQMLNRFEQLWIRLGEALMPLKDAIAVPVLAVVDKIDALITKFPSLTRWVVGGVAALSSLAAAAGTALIAIGALGKLRGLFGRGKAGAEAPGGGLLGNLAGGVQKVWVVNMPGGGLPGMGVPDTGGKAGSAARSIGSRIRSAVAGVMMQASLAWQAIAAWGGKAWGVIARIGAALAPLAARIWAVVSPLGKLAAAFAAGYAVGTLLNKGIDALLSKLLGVPTSLGSVIYDIVQAVKDVPQRMLAIGGQIVDGLLAGLRQRWAALKEGVTDMGSAISGWFKDKLGIRSPSRVFAEMGGHLMGGLRLGIQRAAGLPLSAMGAVAGALATPIAAGTLAMGSAAGALAAPLTAMAPLAPTPAAALAAPLTTMAPLAPTPAAAPIHITVNLNGPATPEAAQDVAAAVRREVERALAESARREQLARRAALIDGGMA
ncbi:phage tail tape measure protein [Tepidimonas taiwanensis]|uniref:Phage tail tape measure protein, TP901 family, core region n=1 Tax=Tepidimonas taiwanensis TaxID=307486 RepID=A0A554XC20_9BURK|nr:phage tail tape measure protein [Tepidimonas taiwanensis]TSE33401.1 phage tail tape measure protein, TP901 family, core region [Tepidimonas taiwanensis]UBQ04441.1 phage tail tape measure protein [Tepidimonas taiwanensis]